MAQKDPPNDPDSPAAEDKPRVLGREAPVRRLRFYQAATAAAANGGHTVLLDARPLRTPRKLPLIVGIGPLAEAIAAEWQAQVATIDPATMPVTRLVFTALDAVADQHAAVAAEIARYAMSDLLCYRATNPQDLARRQAEGWDPVLAWAEAELSVAFVRTAGIMPVVQVPEVARGIEAVLAPTDPVTLAALHVLTTLTGSSVLALAVLRRRLALDEAWRLAHIDEDWQIAKWGEDAEAGARRMQRHAEARSAAAVIDMLRR